MDVCMEMCMEMCMDMYGTDECKPCRCAKLDDSATSLWGKRTYIVIAYIVMAYIATAFVVMAYTSLMTQRPRTGGSGPAGCVYRRIDRHVYRHVRRHASRHVGRHVYRHVCRRLA